MWQYMLYSATRLAHNISVIFSGLPVSVCVNQAHGAEGITCEFRFWDLSLQVFGFGLHFVQKLPLGVQGENNNFFHRECAATCESTPVRTPNHGRHLAHAN